MNKNILYSKLTITEFRVSLVFLLLLFPHWEFDFSFATYSSDDIVIKYPFRNQQESRGILRLASASTASYTVILDNKGDCQFGIGDLKIHDLLTVDKVSMK